MSPTPDYLRCHYCEGVFTRATARDPAVPDILQVFFCSAHCYERHERERNYQPMRRPNE
jgi:hypothetical protein